MKEFWILTPRFPHRIAYLLFLFAVLSTTAFMRNSSLCGLVSLLPLLTAFHCSCRTVVSQTLTIEEGYGFYVCTETLMTLRERFYHFSEIRRVFVYEYLAITAVYHKIAIQTKSNDLEFENALYV